MTPPAPQTRRDWGESGVLLVTLVLFFGLQNRYTLGGPIVSVVLGICVAVTFALSLFTTLLGSRNGTTAVMKIAALVMGVGLIASMAKVIYLVVYHASEIEGLRLLETALVIWVANVAIFAVAYHWIGPREFLFPRSDTEPDPPKTFLDYLFLSFTTSTAFSPTDTAPLTTRARMFVMVESTISLTTIAIAAARAVNILS